MNTRSILLGQIDSSINSVGQALDHLKPGQLDSGLLQRVEARFNIDLNKALRQLRSLHDDVCQLPQQAPLESGWARYLGLRREAEAVLRECLAFIEGVLARMHAIDGGFCRLTDAMLYDLSRRTDLGWSRFTILADGEFFAGLSGIIRIRFPDLTIWNLPISAHEFGHYVAQAMKDSTLAEMIEREKRKDARYEAYLKEHFADLFATYSMGPAFAFLCGLLRFSPPSAFHKGATHPSHAHRMWWILEALRSMDKAQGGGPPLYAYIIGQIKEFWTASLAAAGQTNALEEADLSRLRQWLAELFDAADLNFSGVHYRGWLRAQDLAQEFRSKRVPTLNNDDRLPDVLNAAWLCRSEAENGYFVSWLADEAFKLCTELAGRAEL